MGFFMGVTPRQLMLQRNSTVVRMASDVLAAKIASGRF